MENGIFSYRPITANLEYEVNKYEETLNEDAGENDTYDQTDIALSTFATANPAFQIPTYTGNYSKCANIKRPFIPNLFGKSYRCTHKLTSTTRIVSVFKAQDFLLFNHTILKTSHQREKVQYTRIKIWPFKKIRIKLFKYWENASAPKLYIKINEGYFSFV